MSAPPKFGLITTCLGEELPGFRCPECDEWLEWLSEMDFERNEFQWWACQMCDWDWHGFMTKPYDASQEYLNEKFHARAAIQKVSK